MNEYLQREEARLKAKYGAKSIEEVSDILKSRLEVEHGKKPQ